MKNPNPVNLQTSEEVRQAGWQAESRDADGHLISCHAPIEADDPGIAEWIVECTSRGETVTFWPEGSAAPPQPSLRGIVEAFLHAHFDGPGLIDAVDNYGDRYTSQFLADTIERARAALATTEGSDNG